jgi:TfoX/Sxy family transcriptional regulator of competence genes
MVRDPGLEELLRTDIGDLPGLSEKPMFGGLCFMVNGNMMQFVRDDGAMYRVGKSQEHIALNLPGTEAMYQRGVRKHGLVWLSGDQFDDDDTRLRLTELARAAVQYLPPKERSPC